MQVIFTCGCKIQDHDGILIEECAPHREGNFID